ncbi:MAG TPA: Ig-like domain repeat protein [Acidimicrobiales bacterium]|nr:Ig-like domain repeat protein [Acidimicrobiales bacterium]
MRKTVRRAIGAAVMATMVVSALLVALTTLPASGQTATTPTISNLPASGLIGGSFTATVTSTPTSDGAPSVVSNSPTVCTVSAIDSLTVTYIAAGTCSLTAQTAATTNFDAGVGTPQTFVVSTGTASATVNTPNVYDAATLAVWDGTETTGASAYLPATVTGGLGTPTGTVTFTLYSGSTTCTGSSAAYGSPALASGIAQSTNAGPLGANSYSFQASYSGDGTYATATSPCESFTVGKGTPKITTGVKDNATGSPWTGAEKPGAVAYNTATVNPVGGIAPTGTVTYSFFTNGSCTAPALTTQVGAALSSSGVAANSNPTSSLNQGGYSYLVTYVPGSDPNYLGTSAVCEPFGVGYLTPTAPVISNLPGSGTEFGSFTADVSTDGDGATSVVSSTINVCTVGSDGHTVTFVLYGTCTLTALLGTGLNYAPAAGTAQSISVNAAPRGYWLVGSDGGIFSFGAAQFHGSMGGKWLQRPVVGLTPTFDRGGYWLVASDGGVFSFGDTTFYGSIPGLGINPAGSGLPHSLNAPIVGIVPSVTERGYFMVASDGGVFAFGDAHFAGSCPGVGGCVGTAVAVMPTPTGRGYWVATSTGAVYSFGDAQYYGGGTPQATPVVGAEATPDGRGYWLLYANGTVGSYGDALYLGAPSGYVNTYNPATAIFSTADGHGYWVAAARGDVFAYGNAPFLGGMAATNLNGGIIAGYGF